MTKTSEPNRRATHRFTREALLFLTSLNVVACVAPAAEAPPATQPSRVAFDGPTPVHPMCVAPLVGDLADEQPSVAAIDLEGSARNKSSRPRVTSDGGIVTARDDDGGYVAYRLVGTTPGGLHVLIVMVNGGGSGVFEDALWVRFERDQVWENGGRRDRTMLVRVGQFTLGDRDDGDVRLDGAKLVVGASKYRDRETVIGLD